MEQHPAIMGLLASCTRLWNGLNGQVARTTKTAPAELMRVALEVQTSAIFQCPEELFSEILSHFPILRWADVHYFALEQYQEIPDIYGDRAHVLLVLSATCRAMRLRFLPVAWEYIVMCFHVRSSRVPSRLQLQCRTLTSDPSIALHVRVMTVSLSYGEAGKTTKDFVRCLSALPNLHTLAITSIGGANSRFRVGLKYATLPQIRTAILPPAAHHILRHCPNIEDLTCSPDGPNKEFFQSIAVGKLNLRRFATLRPGQVFAWTKLAKICPQIKELSFTHRVYTLQGSEKCLTALKNLSIIRLVHYVQSPTRCIYCMPSLSQQALEEVRSRRAFLRNSEDAWEEVKNVAREHLKNCDSSGPKILRTVVLTHSGRNGVEYLEPEEVFSV